MDKNYIVSKQGASCGCSHDIESSCITVVPIFNHLEPEQMAEVMGVIQSASFKKGEILYREGGSSDSLYIVNRGSVKIYRLSESGKEQLIRILNPGDFTGELALFREAHNEGYAEAMSESDVCMIKRDDFNALLQKYPTIALKVLSEFANRLGALETQTTRFATEKVETRLAMFLAECQEKAHGSPNIELPMSKKNLASYLGTTPETLSRKLTDFEEAGYIQQRTSKNITILDLDELLLP